MSSESKSTVTYRHNQSYNFKKSGVKHVIKEDLIDGEKGISFHYLRKEGEDDKKFYMITVKQTGKEYFFVNMKEGEKSDVSTVNMVGLMKIVNGNNNLKFVSDYITKERPQTPSVLSVWRGAGRSAVPPVCEPVRVEGGSQVGGAKRKSRNKFIIYIYIL